MAIINNSSVTKRVIDGMGINTATDRPPTTTEEIKPVFVANDNGKLKYYETTCATNTMTFTIPSNMYWEIIHIGFTYSSNATVGNRIVRVVCRNNSLSDTFFDSTFAAQAASIGWVYFLSPTLGTSVDATNRDANFPRIIPPTYKITIFDNAGISATDTMKISLCYREFNLEA